MKVELNGRPAELPREATVADAVASAGADGEDRGVAVAVEGEVVPRADWPRRVLADGEEVEIVRAVQGG